MAQWRVIIETRSPSAAGREAFEITPPPAPGTERAVLRELVAGIHPGAVERAHEGGRSVFDDGDREITARFEAGGEPATGTQARLFDD